MIFILLVDSSFSFFYYLVSYLTSLLPLASSSVSYTDSFSTSFWACFAAINSDYSAFAYFMALSFSVICFLRSSVLSSVDFFFWSYSLVWASYYAFFSPSAFFIYYCYSCYWYNNSFFCLHNSLACSDAYYSSFSYSCLSYSFFSSSNYSYLACSSYSLSSCSVFSFSAFFWFSSSCFLPSAVLIKLMADDKSIESTLFLNSYSSRSFFNCN